MKDRQTIIVTVDVAAILALLLVGMCGLGK